MFEQCCVLCVLQFCLIIDYFSALDLVVLKYIFCFFLSINTSFTILHKQNRINKLKNSLTLYKIKIKLKSHSLNFKKQCDVASSSSAEEV